MKNKKIVLAMGAFDVLHEGHLNFFKQAAEMGELHVVIARETSIVALKGTKPWDSESERVKHVQAVPEVFKAHLGNEGDKFKIVEEINPDVIVLGYDQMTTENLQAGLDKRGLQAEIVRLKPFNPDKYKSSIVKNQDQVNR